MLENKQTEGKPSKKLAKPRALASIIIALVVIVAGGAYYAIQAFADDAPPKLTSDAKYQGLIKDGQYDFAAWETADKNKFEENKEDAEDESWNVIDIRSTSQGANYLYAEEDLTFYDVITRIDPKGESIVVARYNPKSSKFDIYPQTNYYNRNLTNVVDPKDEDEATIQAGEGFMVVSTKSSKGYGLYHGDDMNEITESPACKLSKGWNLVASHTEDLKALVAHCYEDVDTIWVETDPTAFDKKFKKC